MLPTKSSQIAPSPSETAAPQSEPPTKSNLGFIIKLIICPAPLYALLTYFSYPDARLMALFIIMYVLMIPGMISNMKVQDLKIDRPAEAKKWVWASATIWLIQYVVLPMVLIDWLKLPKPNLIAFWIMIVMAFIGGIVLHVGYLLICESYANDVHPDPPQEMV